MCKGRIILHPNTSTETYLNKIKEIGKDVTVKEFSEFIGKSKDLAKNVLYNLYKGGLINRRIIWKRGSFRKYLYFLKC